MAGPLDASQLRAYERDGFVRLDAAFGHEIAAECRAVLWDQLDEDQDDPSTRTRPVVRLGRQTQPAFTRAATAPRWVAAIDQIVGAAGDPELTMSGTVAVRFPIPGDPGDDGWHVDGSYAGPDGRWWVNVRSDGRALLMLVLFSDVGTDDAPTRIRVGSHHDLPAVLAHYGDAGLASLDVALPDRVHARPLALATGRAGDVYLCHPFVVHAAQRNHGRTPRFLGQPGVPWRLPR